MLLTQRQGGSPPLLNDGGPCDDAALARALTANELLSVPPPAHMPENARSRSGLGWAHEQRLLSSARA